MGYTPKTWQTGNVINASDLNNYEQTLNTHDLHFGDMSTLLTTNKTLAGAINELKGLNGGGSAPVYNTLTDLQNALPSGSTQPAWVIADNAWYYWSGAVVVSAPVDVTGLSVSSITTSTLSLSWTSSSGATSYDVYQGSTLLGNTTSTNYSVSGLSASTAYTFKVIAKNSGGSSAGVTVNATTTAAATPPADVTNLATSNISNSSTTLTWTASTGATSYDVYNGATLLGNTTSTNYQATGLSASTTYTFKVVAKNAAGSSAGVTLNVTTLASAPNSVTNLAVGTVTSSSIPVTWSYTNGSDAVANFEVAYSSDGGNTFTVASNAVNSSSTSYTVSGLSASTAYVVRVVAIDGSGNRSSAVTVNATTAAAPDTTPPVVTASPAAGTYTSTQTVTLSGTDNSGGTVTIYYTTDGTTPTYPVSGTTQTYSSPISVSATETITYIGVDPSGNVSSPVAATYTITAVTTGTVLASDDFNRADSTTTLGATDSYSGGSAYTWTSTDIGWGTGTWGISSNTAYCLSSNVQGTTIDVGQSDVDISVTLSTYASDEGIVFRVPSNSNGKNFYRFYNASGTNSFYLQKYVAGGSSNLIAPITYTKNAGDILRVVCKGSSITVYINGVQQGTVTDTAYQTATKHGIHTYASSTPVGARFDNFVIKAS